MCELFVKGQLTVFSVNVLCFILDSTDAGDNLSFRHKPHEKMYVCMEKRCSGGSVETTKGLYNLKVNLCLEEFTVYQLLILMAVCIAVKVGVRMAIDDLLL